MINFTNCIRQNEKLHSISREIHKKIIKGGAYFSRIFYKGTL